MRWVALWTSLSSSSTSSERAESRSNKHHVSLTPDEQAPNWGNRMLIIPTSLSTGILLQIEQPFAWLAITAVGYSGVTLGAYSLWEMLMSALVGRKPRSSRLKWLGGATLLLAMAMLGSGLMFGPVTFNADSANWVSTTWGSVLSAWCMAAFVLCVAVLVVLRAIDALNERRLMAMPYFAWWAGGAFVCVAYGLLLTWNGELVGGGATETAVMVGALGLTASGLGSLLAVAVIRALRARAAGGAAVAGGSA